MSKKNIKKEEKPSPPIETGELSTGIKWEFVLSRNSSVPNGKHFVTHPVNNQKLDTIRKNLIPITEEEEMLVTSHRLTKKHAIKKGDWRLGLNGPGLAYLSNWHAHGICPDGDRVVRFVDTIEQIKKY